MRQIPTKPIAALLAGLCLTLPVAASAQSQMAVLDYTCADARRLSVAFINAGDGSFAVLQDGGRLVTLEIAPSGSGARYLSDDGRMELFTKGNAATASLIGDEDIPLYRDCDGVAQAR
ncbi:Membrane-bound inhibitor of C-type lysozyme [Paracoccus isoporae]|uniref:Membrane-bound inhibitor of C-type lysozyme n=1 Tax=Paracoccus isoporae TaxID=591205 RepID=A0A1G6U854_9RHOB|nr:MliC family protein [Paracoccus isoporae]SDD37570.1 Membrane-bound inhibitor of C-type lysozyme [Paracoccus isoporae]